MKPLPCRQSPVPFLILWIVSTKCAIETSTLPDSTSNLPDQAINNIDEPSEYVDTCECLRVSTYARTLSHEWTVNDASLYFNEPARSSWAHKRKVYILQTAVVDDSHGGSWTMELISQYYNQMMLNFTAILPYDDGGDYNLNLIGGELQVLIGGNRSIDTEFVGCVGWPKPGQNNITTRALWEGYCTLKFGCSDLASILESDSIQVLLRLQLMYLNHSKELSLNGRECNRLRLDAFVRPQFAISKESSRRDYAGFDIQMEAAHRHRVSLEWSISNWTETLKPQPAGTDWLQFFRLQAGDQLNDWPIWAEVSRDGSQSGQNITMMFSVRGKGVRYAFDGFQLAVVTTGNNHTKWVPEAGISIDRYEPDYRIAKFMVTEADLDQWNHGVVMLVEYVLVYQYQPLASTEANLASTSAYYFK